MTYETEENTESPRMELATFQVGQALCGIDLQRIQEVNKQTVVTRVPQSEAYVEGVLNLRGRIVTVVDLGRKIGLSPIERNAENRNIIVTSAEEQIGLLVDRISDVLTADAAQIEFSPANLGGIQGTFFKGVLKAKGSLVGILDMAKVLEG